MFCFYGRRIEMYFREVVDLIVKKLNSGKRDDRICFLWFIFIFYWYSGVFIGWIYFENKILDKRNKGIFGICYFIIRNIKLNGFINDGFSKWC